MLQVQNQTPFVAQLFPLPDQQGIDTAFTVVKATFTLDAPYGIAPEQVPITLIDEHFGDPLTTSVRAPSDVSLMKRGTDVVLVGSAWTPNGEPTHRLDVSLSIGDKLHKRVRVFGERVWDTDGSIASVAPFVRMPLVWERAYGGADVTKDGPALEPRNPVGVGFRGPRSERQMAGTPLPNIEDPTALITSARDAPPPAAFAPVAPHWLPRRRYAGTYDESWQQTRAPFLPDDFDVRFCSVAPVDLASARPLEGGEAVEVHHASEGGVLRFALPSFGVRTTYQVNSTLEERRAVLDTVIIEPDARRLVVVWRSALRCDKKILNVRRVLVAIETKGARVA